MLLTGIGATAISNLSAVESAAVINAGINASADCISTKIGGGRCNAKDATITAAFSFGMGWAGGIATELIGTKNLFTLFAAKAGIQLFGNTMQRTARGNATTDIQATTDINEGIVTTAAQLLPGNPYLLSHIGEAIAGILDMAAANTLWENPINLIPERNE